MRLVLLLAVALLVVPMAAAQTVPNPLCTLTSSGCTAYHVIRDRVTTLCESLLAYGCPVLP